MSQLKPQDLRYGNYVNYNHMNLPICGIWSPKPLKEKRFADKWLIELFDGASTIDCTIDDIHPIPLTEEIILMAGFKKHHENNFWFLKNNICFGLAGFVEVIDGIGNAIRISSSTHNLHELQNIVRFTTGEELEINLK